MIWFIYFWRFWGSRAVLLFIRATVPGMCPRWRVLAGQLSVAVRLSWPHMLLGSYQKRDTIFVLFNLCAIPYSKFQRHTSFIYNIIYMYVCVSLGKDRFSNEPFESILGIHLQKDHFLCALDWKFALGAPTCNNSFSPVSALAPSDSNTSSAKREHEHLDTDFQGL